MIFNEIDVMIFTSCFCKIGSCMIWFGLSHHCTTVLIGWTLILTNLKHVIIYEIQTMNLYFAHFAAFLEPNFNLIKIQVSNRVNSKPPLAILACIEGRRLD